MAARPEFHSLNGRPVPFADARVHMLTPAFRYGACAFEGLRRYRDAKRAEVHVFRLREHLGRRHSSMHVMRFEHHPSDAEMRQALRDVIRANDIVAIVVSA